MSSSLCAMNGSASGEPRHLERSRSGSPLWVEPARSASMKRRVLVALVARNPRTRPLAKVSARAAERAGRAERAADSDSSACASITSVRLSSSKRCGSGDEACATSNDARGEPCAAAALDDLRLLRTARDPGDLAARRWWTARPRYHPAARSTSQHGSRFIIKRDEPCPQESGGRRFRGGSARIVAASE